MRRLGLGSNGRTNVDVLLFAAGFGKRLLPLTETIPKPLVEVGGKCLIERNLEMIARSGMKRVFVNLHYHGQMIRDFIGSGARWGLEVIYVEEDPILDTGGTIKNIENLVQSEFLLTVNSDIAIGEDFSLIDVVHAHTAHTASPIATMVLRPDAQAKAYGEIGIDSDARVRSFVGKQYIAGEIVESLMYLGIQVLSKKVFSYMPAAGSVFGVTRETYPAMLSAQEYVHSVKYLGYWSDVGTHERLSQARERFGVS